MLEEPVNQAIEALVAPHRASTPTHRGEWRSAFARTTLFSALEERLFTNEHVQDADGLADRVASISFIASLPADERERVVAAARELAADGPVTVPYRTEVFVCDTDIAGYCEGDVAGGRGRGTPARRGRLSA